MDDGNERPVTFFGVMTSILLAAGLLFVPFISDSILFCTDTDLILVETQASVLGDIPFSGG